MEQQRLTAEVTNRETRRAGPGTASPFTLQKDYTSV
jgi:hypothetical protein